METSHELFNQRNEILCSMLRREFDEAKTQTTARLVIETAYLTNPPLSFLTDMRQDFESHYGVTFEPRVSPNWEEKMLFEQDETTLQWYCWKASYGKDLASIMKDIGWCYSVPNEIFIDNDSLDTAAAEHDHSATKFLDPRTMIGASQRVYHGRGLLKIVTF